MVYVYHMHAWCPQWLEESIGFPGTGASNSCKWTWVFITIELLLEPPLSNYKNYFMFWSW